MVSAVLLMAGKGTRTGLKENKTLLKINNKPLFMYSMERFLELNIEVVLVINKKEEDIIKKYLNGKDVKIAYGGNTRGESSYNGLLKCSNDYVLIHDAARPFVSREVIKKVISSYPKPALVYSQVINTIKQKTPDGIITIDRDSLLSAETPQAALKCDFLKAYKKAFCDKLYNTDDISLIERYITRNIELISSSGNKKITTHEDILEAKVRLGEINV